MTLSRQEYDAALRGLPAFEQIGFLLEDFGNGTVLVREIPTMLPLDDVTGAVQEAAAKLADGRQQMLPKRWTSCSIRWPARRQSRPMTPPLCRRWHSWWK